MIEPNMSLEDFMNFAGTELEPSEWLLVDQQRINQFAEATNDNQFIHVDPIKAADLPFGGTIAHGFLTMSLLSYMMAQHMPFPEGLVMGINYGSDRVRFVQAVKVDSRIRVHTKIIEVKKRRGGQFMVKSSVSIEIENERRPALTAELLSLYFVEGAT